MVDSPILQGDPRELAAFLKEIISRVIITEMYLWPVFHVSFSSVWASLPSSDSHDVSSSPFNVRFSLPSNKGRGQ